MAVEYIKFDFEADNAPLLKALNEVTKGFSKLDKLGTYASNVSKQFDKLTGSFKKTSKQGSVLRNVLVGISGVQIGKWLAEGTKEAIDYIETLNLFTVAMKDSYDAGMQFVNMMSEMYGLDPKEVMDSVGLFYEMGYAVGMPDKAAQKMSLTMAALSNDIASFFNYDIAQTSDNLISGLRGMSRAVVKYGMDLRATAVEQFAISKGFTGQFETMNEASRELLRFLAIIEQTTDAQGDFARTIEQPANQLRILKAQVTQVSRAIGNIFLGALDSVLYKIVGVTMAIKVMIDVFATLLGINYEPEAVDPGFGEASSAADDYANSVGGIGASASDAKKKLDSLVAPFDELNILQENTPSGGASAGGAGGDWGAIDPELLKLVDEVDYKLANIRLKAQDVKEAILGFMGITWDENANSWVYSADEFERRLKAALPGLQQTITAIFDVDWSLIGAQLSLIFEVIKRIAKLTIKKVVNDFERLTGISIDESLANFFENLRDNLGNITRFLVENQEAIVSVLATVLELWLTWQAFSAVTGIISSIATVLGTLATVGSVVFGPLGTVIDVVSAAFTVMFNLLGAGLSKVMGPLVTFASKIPVIGNLVSGLSNALTVLTGIFAGPLAAAISGAITLFAALFVAGFVKWAAESERFKELLSNIFERLGDIFTHFGELVSALVTAFVAGVTFMATKFSSVYEAIVATIDWLLIAFDGIIEFLTGVFTGDWDKALQGLAKIVGGVMGAIMSGITAVLNALIGVVETGLNFLLNALYDFVKGALDMVEKVADIIGINVSFPDEVNITLPRINAPDPVQFATGGVVTGPTRALIGEGRYDEAVIPLGESPQLQELVEKIGQRVESGGETIVKVYIGDKEWDAFTYQSAKRGESLVGAQPVKSYG